MISEYWAWAKRRAHHARVAVVQAGHGVEQMREATRALGHGLHTVFIGAR